MSCNLFVLVDILNIEHIKHMYISNNNLIIQFRINFRFEILNPDSTNIQFLLT